MQHVQQGGRVDFSALSSTVAAEPKSLLKKPKAAKWKKTYLHHYYLLLKVFSKDRAIGELAATAKEKKLKAMGESSVDNQEESVGELPRPSESSDSSNVTKGKKRKAGKMFMDELSSIKVGLDNVAEALREAYRFLSAKHSRIREVFSCPLEERKAYLMEIMFEKDI
ncbi:hypothetical protein RDABS01_021293 [Bienertia sinuspersici]